MQHSWTPTGLPAQWTSRGPAIAGPATARGPWKSFAEAGRESMVERDFAFAEAALNKPSSMGGFLKESSAAVENLQFFTHKKPLVYLFWGAEVLWLMFIFVSASHEFFKYCPFETGLVPRCSRCFSTTFLAWLSIHIVAWSLNLFVYVLLVSRGFRFSPVRPMRCLPDAAVSGIPKPPVLLFLGLNGFLLLWGVTGFVVAILSNRCDDVAGLPRNITVPRSSSLFLSTFFTAILSPFLFFFGRRALLPYEDGARQPLAADSYRPIDSHSG